jgi:outer membrane receptor for ferrienterochelin and colicins
MKALITILCALLWMGTAWAQGTGSLAGKISDAEGVGVPQANVAVAGPNLQGTTGATSDEKGSFDIGGIPAGVYAVTVTHIGFKEEVLEGVQVEVGKQVILDFRLESQVIFLNQQVVSASRRQEKVLDAPASVSVIEAEEIRNNPTLSVIEHVKDLPGVDFAQYGLVQNSVVVRGFNNIFSGALLSMTDNRLARVPSLRVNSYNFIPVTNDDVERIEVVLGPGAALYGPNAANGVMHVITRSPLTSAGTSVNVGLGERSLRMASVRHAGTVSDKLGYKISAQYYTGEDWEAYDSEESAQAKADGGYQVTVDGQTLYSQRDFDIDRQSAELRLDYQPTDELSAVLSSGYNNGTFIEQTGLGAGQATDWSYNYVQARLLYRDWFAQVYRNWSDAGDTFLLRSGADIVDKSSLTVFQAQHMAYLGQRQQFTYGFDALLTRPDTEGTISGQNEEDDDINEIGAYLQSETALSDKLDLVLALRYDDHNRVDKAELSPRAALVFKPQSDQTVRLTYNRAFSTPTTNNLYLDLVSSPDAFGIGAAFGPSLGYEPKIDVRAQGTYRTGFDEGFTFKRDANDRPLYHSPFGPVIAAQLGAMGMTPETPGYPLSEDGWYIALDDPLATGVMWGIGREAVLSELVPQFQGLVTGQLMLAGMEAGVAQATAGALAEMLPGIVPEQLFGLENSLGRLNLETKAFDPIDDAVDVPRTKSTITQTFEVGYKGVIGGKLVLAADAYRTKTDNFVGPLAVETPNVFLNMASLIEKLGPAFAQALADGDNAQIAQALGALDTLPPGLIEGLQGNNNGSAVDEMTAIFAGGVAQIPFGTVSPEQAYDPDAVIVTYRNFGEVTVNGLDLSLAYYPIDELMLTGNFSYVDDNFFEDLDGIADVTLNAPKTKFKLGCSYTLPGIDLTVGGKMRYADSFKMQSGVYHGEVDSYTVFDMSLGYRPPIEQPISVRLDVSNLLDNVHREFVGGAEIGRLVFCQVGVSF